MDLPNGTTRTPSCTLPASLIFTGKDLGWFLRFRQQQKAVRLPSSAFGRLPSATEYANFMSWSKNKRAARTLDAGMYDATRFEELDAHLNPLRANSEREAGETNCGHMLHSYTSVPKAEQCPVCIINAHVEWMRVLTKSLCESGGMKQPQEGAGSRHEQVLQAWNCEKLDSVHQVYEFEKIAKQESRLEAANLDIDTEMVKLAQQAVEIYWNELGVKYEASEAKERKEKSVGFDKDTNFEAGRCQAYFWKKSPRYEVGKYHCEAEEEAGDSSEDSLHMGDSDTEIDEALNDECSEDDSEDSEDEDEDYEEDDDIEDEEVDGADYIVFGD